VNLSGASTSAILNVASFGGNASGTGPWSGDDQSLMEDLIGSGSNPLPIQFSGLLVGNYNVLLYGQNATGNSFSTFTINNVTQTTGGAWSGSHNLGGSYTMFTNVSVLSGNLTIDFTSNCNGIQLQYSPVPEPTTLLVILPGLAVMARRRKHS
jgi:hypothetical protein